MEKVCRIENVPENVYFLNILFLSNILSWEDEARLNDFNIMNHSLRHIIMFIIIIPDFYQIIMIQTGQNDLIQIFISIFEKPFL